MLTIGQMARIFNITPKTLRHYDFIGLFSPSHVNEDNQYRYYTSDQVNQLRRILFFRSIGLGPEVIRELVQSGTVDDTEKVKCILLEHSESIHREMTRQQDLLNAVEEMISNMDYTRGMHMKPKITTRDGFNVIGMEFNSGAGVGSI